MAVPWGGMEAALTPRVCVPAGTRADVSPDQVATVLWRYFTELGSSAKETVDQLQQAEITKQLK